MDSLNNKKIDTRTGMSDEIIESHPSGTALNGITYGAWTVEWWRWAMSFPSSISPVNDETGIYANAGQPRDAFFLAGKFGSENNKFPRRRCIIPHGKSILFPTLNCQANLLEDLDLKTPDAIREHVAKDIDTIVKNDCYVNEIRIPSVRVPSDPRVFKMKLMKEHEGDMQMMSTLAAADGYWVFLKPLPVGEYEIKFRGSCEQGRLSSGADYIVTIK